MKKLLAILLALALMFSFAACGKDKDKDDKKDEGEKSGVQNDEPVIGQNQVEVELPTEDILGGSGSTTTASGWRADMARYEQIIEEMVEAATNGEDTSEYEEEMAEIDERMEDVLDTLSESEQAEFEEEAMEMLERLTTKYGDFLEDVM